MNDGCRISGPHLIKLHNKQIEVQIEYHSPPKKEPRERTKQITLFQPSERDKDELLSNNKSKNLSSFMSLKRLKDTKRSPYFYCKSIQEAHHVLEDYETFHQRIANNQSYPQKLKVYSNSKELKTTKIKPTSKALATKDTNSQNVSKLPHYNAPIRKIKLYSPVKAPSRQNDSLDKPSKVIKLHQNNILHPISLKGTPDRRFKLEVTSSKSRNKHDSMLSNKNQKSFEASVRAKPRQKQGTPERFLKSFNSLHQQDQ